MKKLISAICFVLLTSMILSCSSKPDQEHNDESHESEHENEIHLSKDVLKSLNVEWATVKKEPFYEEIDATGKVIQDSQKMTYVFSKSSGTVQKIFVRVGEAVQKGQALLQIGGVQIKAPKKGTILSINTSIDSRVGMMESIVAMGLIDPMRVIFDVYPKDMDKIILGQKVEVELIGHKKQRFSGIVEYISPNLDETSQTLKVGADVQNTDHHLKFGMFVRGHIFYKTSEEVLVVPEEAVVRFNKDFAVFLPGDEDGSFIKQPVQIGRRDQGIVEILKGLKLGDKVVTKGSFVLKSESLRENMGEGHAH